ncbi:MAG: hypothetical protein GQ552_01280 [Flavobacteriaceae bacterium]|nr:hypothetical protein [Flavobacteriaceae bacterium]
MKKVLLTFAILVLLISCDEKKATKKQESVKKEGKTETIEQVPENEIQKKEFKTKSGKIFIVNEEKPSASLSNITVTPKGFSEVNNPLKMEESDPFDYALVADINNDGFDELYIITRGTGSGSYANIYGFASNKDKSVTPIYVPELTNDDFSSLFKGYMGHDKFYIEENKLLRKYPVYKKDDSNSNPTGGERVLEYHLKSGEASWVLELIK